MDLGSALMSHLTSNLPLADQQIDDFHEALEYLVDLAGSASAAARIIGVPPSTMRHWVSSGRLPSRERREDVIDAAVAQQRRDSLDSGRESDLRSGFASMAIVGRIVYDGVPEPTRVAGIGAYLDDGVGDRLVDAYLDGADSFELAAIFGRHVNDSGFYEETLTPFNEGGLQWDIDYFEGWG